MKNNKFLVAVKFMLKSFVIPVSGFVIGGILAAVLGGYEINWSVSIGLGLAYSIGLIEGQLTRKEK